LVAVERSLAIVIQICLAVLVFQAVVERKMLWLGVAVTWHMVVDALAVLGLPYWGVYLTEGVLAILAGVSLCAILLLRRRQPQVPQSLDAQIQTPARTMPSPPVKVNLTKDRLDDSRYDS